MFFLKLFERISKRLINELESTTENEPSVFLLYISIFALVLKTGQKYRLSDFQNCEATRVAGQVIVRQ